MQTVGIRELKANFSQYLSKVKLGERIIVTDRKKEVAIIAPLREKPGDDKILRLMERGIAQWSGGKPRGLQPRIISKGGKVSAAVIEGRR